MSKKKRDRGEVRESITGSLCEAYYLIGKYSPLSIISISKTELSHFFLFFFFGNSLTSYPLSIHSTLYHYISYNTYQSLVVFF